MFWRPFFIKLHSLHCSCDTHWWIAYIIATCCCFWTHRSCFNCLLLVFDCYWSFNSDHFQLRSFSFALPLFCLPFSVIRQSQLRVESNKLFFARSSVPDNRFTTFSIDSYNKSKYNENTIPLRDSQRSVSCLFSSSSCWFSNLFDWSRKYLVHLPLWYRQPITNLLTKYWTTITKLMHFLITLQSLNVKQTIYWPLTEINLLNKLSFPLLRY